MVEPAKLQTESVVNMNDANLYKGYKGQALEVLQHFQAAVWSDITFVTPT